MEDDEWFLAGLLLGIIFTGIISILIIYEPKQACECPADTKGVLIVQPPVTQIQKNQVAYFKTNEGTIPLSEEAVLSYSVEYLKKTRERFNSRYNLNISMPTITFGNEPTKSYYTLPNTINISRLSGFWRYNSTTDKYFFWRDALEQIIRHEFCHHAQYETGGFPKAGESFCDVFANISRTENECVENNLSAYYCAPYRIELLTDRQGFIDCVWSSISNKLTKNELDDCFRQYRK